MKFEIGSAIKSLLTVSGISALGGIIYKAGNRVQAWNSLQAALDKHELRDQQRHDEVMKQIGEVKDTMNVLIGKL